MPEGDTIHRTARRLADALEGHTLTRFEARRATGPAPRPGEVVVGVEAVGKHLLVRFSGGVVLHTHMKMTGSWHLYRQGERWTRPAHRSRAVIEVEGWVAVCFSAPVVRLGREPALRHLGPDLCRPDVPVDAIVERVARLAPADTEIAEVLLDQRIASGVGNVYKSEVLYACGIDPFRGVGALSSAELREIYRTAARQLQANLGSGPRRTVAAGLAVYGRADRHCRACRTTIRSRRQGPDQRVTYWCPTCQPSVT